MRYPYPPFYSCAALFFAAVLLKLAWDLLRTLWG